MRWLRRATPFCLRTDLYGEGYEPRPLSRRRSAEIVRQMHEGRLSRYIFPGQVSGKPLSNIALLTLLKRMNSGEKKWLDPVSGRPITAHGFRASFRTWVEEVATFFPML